MASSGLYVNPNNGQTQAGLQPFRNILINGDMRIAQRGTNFTNISGGGVKTYTLDRWWIAHNGTANNNISQISSISLDGFTYAMRIQRPLNSTNALGFYVGQGIESINSADLKNKNITLSFYIRKGANLSGFVYAQLISGSGNDQDALGSVNGGWTNYNQFFSIALNISTNWVKYNYTATVPSNCNQLGVAFIPVFSGTALAADYFDITGVQLELGSVATPFEVRPFPVELQLCQRYYETKKDGGVTFAGDFVDLMFTFSAVKRKIPQVIFYDYIGNISKTTNFFGSASAQTNNIAGATIREVTFYNFRLGASSGGSANTAFISFTADAEL